MLIFKSTTGGDLTKQLQPIILVQPKEKSSLFDPTIIVTLSTNQLSSCLESLTIDDLYPSVTTNGVTIAGICGGGGDGDADSMEKRSSTSTNSDFEQVICLTAVTSIF